MAHSENGEVLRGSNTTQSAPVSHGTESKSTGPDKKMGLALIQTHPSNLPGCNKVAGVPRGVVRMRASSRPEIVPEQP